MIRTTLHRRRQPLPGALPGLALALLAGAQLPAQDPLVIDDETSALDATVVTASPAPVRPPAPDQTVRRATASRPVEVEVYDTLAPAAIPGGPAAMDRLPGSGFFVTSQDIRDQNYSNVNRVLAKVPGVYTREEDGAGLFPNISIRGVDGTRSERITMMEDGILQAPAPYSAPAAYYSPNTARMAGIEILKGSSQVAFGPHTTGGVVNFLSTPIPKQEQFYLRSTYGSNATGRIHSHYGNTVETEAGRIGYLAEIYYGRSDGFRKVEGGHGIPASRDTGFELIEPTFKLSWAPNTVLEQKFEFKYGYTSLDSNESYLGLTEDDFRANPYRRYAGSYLDNIPTEQHRTYLKHDIALTDNLDLQTAGYYNHFDRDWFKIRAVNGAALHTTLGPTGNPANLATLKGEAPGVLNYRSNARTYESYGGQISGVYRFETGEAEHALQFGVRQHSDNVRRFQEDVDVTLIGPGIDPVITPLGPGSGGNRFESADATALWLRDDISIGRLTLSPGVRHERVRLHYTDFASDDTNTVTGRGNGTVDWWLGSIGLNYDIDENRSVFGGIHQGIALPGPRAAVRNDVRPERALTYELGARRSSENLNLELVGFYTEFERLVSTGAGLGLGGLDVTNAGSADVGGVEFLASYDPWQDRGVRLPLFASVTWTPLAELNEVLVAGGGENIFGDGAGGPGIPGARLPYIPDWKLALGAGLHTDVWGLDLMATYISETFGTALNSREPVNSARQGLVDGGFIVDLSGHWHLNDTTKMVAGISNLFDEVMVASRIPEGPRVNAPREFYLGFEILWEPRDFASGKSLAAN